MSLKPQDSSDQLRNELKTLADTLEEVMKSSGQASETEMAKLKEKAENVVKASRDTLAQTSDKIVEHTKEMAGKADSYVHDKPWNGIGMAAAAGLVLGVLLSRR